MKAKKDNQQIAKCGMRAGALYGCLSDFLCYIHLWIYVCSGICWKKEGVRAPLGARGLHQSGVVESMQWGYSWCMHKGIKPLANQNLTIPNSKYLHHCIS